MACKIVVRRFTAGLDFIADCVNAYPFEKYLGDLVENQGGAFVIIEINNADFSNLEIQDLLSPNLNPTTHNNIYGLRPVQEGGEFFTELLTTGRINVTLERLLEYKVKH
tara:strand:+ start:171 stop:497 length:327 start_codon:yes stop_codon:yes gene_type:complete